MYCRGRKKREEIVRDYEIDCIAYMRLLEGRTIRSDAEKDITRTYYIFICKNKTNSSDIRKICCGEGAGRELLKLANITSPILFNMLHEDATGPSGGNSGSNNSSNGIIWHPAAKQLYDAIMILINAWDLRPGPIFNYLKEARKYSYCEPYVNRIEKINNILHRHNTSMRDILKLLAKNNNIKEYKFDLLEEILHRSNIVSYFEDTNGR